MRTFLFRARTALPYLLIAVVLCLPAALLGQDSTATDKTGLFGPVINKFWPVIVTFLTSLTVKIIAVANQGFAKTSEPVKWVALYAFALAYNQFAGWVGIVHLDPLAPTLGLSLVQTGAAALVYKFGGHRTPEISEQRAAPFSR